VTGHQYRDLIANYIHHNYAAEGLVVYVEVSLGKTVIGKDRAIDVFVVRPQDRKAIAIECKYQDSLGSVDEKIPYALQDLEALWVPGCLAYAGKGWSRAMLDWAATAAAARGVTALRLDCAPRPELLRLYADCGFTRLDHEPRSVCGYDIVRFERRIDDRAPAPKPGGGDRYPNFAALAAAETAGVTYRIRSIDRASPVLFILLMGAPSR